MYWKTFLKKIYQDLLTKPSSSDYENIVKITQAEYDALVSPDINTLYIIEDKRIDGGEA